MPEFRLILGSQSPRRHQLLKSSGFEFEVCLPKTEENISPGWTPEDCVTNLALQKANDVVQQSRMQYGYDDSMLVLSADTVVALGNEIFGKPKDFDDAYQMLWRLTRNPHRVLTGVSLWPISWTKGLVGYSCTYITMRPMTSEEICAYINSGESMGKAGAYAIQENADKFVEHINGPWDNVVGLPIDLVGKLIQEWREKRNILRTSHYSRLS